jgi:hypothetical protein
MEAFETPFVHTKAEKCEYGMQTYYCARQPLCMLFFIVIINNIVICCNYYFSFDSISMLLFVKTILDASCVTNSKLLAQSRPCQGSGG